MEHATPKELRKAQREMRGIVRGDLPHNDVAGLQIVKALLKEARNMHRDIRWSDAFTGLEKALEVVASAHRLVSDLSALAVVAL